MCDDINYVRVRRTDGPWECEKSRLRAINLFAVRESGGAGLPQAKIWGGLSTPCPPYFSAPAPNRMPAKSGELVVQSQV